MAHNMEGPESEYNGRCKVVAVLPPLRFGNRRIKAVLQVLHCSEYNYTLDEKMVLPHRTKTTLTSGLRTEMLTRNTGMVFFRAISVRAEGEKFALRGEQERLPGSHAILDGTLEAYSQS